MSTYVMSDIHGCYDEFISMLKKTGFSETDHLIIAGDLIDRGGQSYEMLKWIESCPPNVTLLFGNHEKMFIENIGLMIMLDSDEKLETDFSSNSDTKVLYDSVQYFIRSNALPFPDFDKYGTVKKLLEQNNVTLSEGQGY